MKQKNAIIISGFAGIGKTYLAKKYKNVIDLESTPFKYDYTNVSKDDYEKLKGNKNRLPNINFPQNYIDAINSAKAKYDVVFVYCCDEALELYKKYNIDVTVCYPNKEAFLYDYAQRYANRGNTSEWVNGIIKYYDEFITKKIAKQKCKKIVLLKGETIEDFLINNGYNFKK